MRPSRRALLPLVLLSLGCADAAGPEPGPSTLPIPAAANPTTAEMFARLEEFIGMAAETNRQLLPLNPRYAAQIEAKIALLETPGLALAMSEGERYAQATVTTNAGGAVPLAALYPDPAMRGDAADAVRAVREALPTLERFVGDHYPYTFARIWYGFTLGARGGGASMEVEDRASYAARVGAGALPYETTVVHELAHSWFSNEALAQLLELYAYNLARTGSEDPADWTFTRGWVRDHESNQNVAALLDVYALLGPRAMGDALRAVRPLGARYGEPLSAAARQAFVERAPEALRARVAAKVALVTM